MAGLEVVRKERRVHVALDCWLEVALRVQIVFVAWIGTCTCSIFKMAFLHYTCDAHYYFAIFAACSMSSSGSLASSSSLTRPC